MPRNAHLEINIAATFNLDSFPPGFQICPVIIDPHLVGIVGVGPFFIKVYIIVFKHGQPPRGRVRVADKGKGDAGGMIPIETETGVFQVGFVPYRRLGIHHVGVIDENNFAGLCFFPGDHPPVAADPQGHRKTGNNFVNGSRQALGRCRIFRVSDRNLLCIRGPSQNEVF